MKQTMHLFLCITLVWVVYALWMPAEIYAQDDPGMAIGIPFATRSSPFDPPSKDVFVADDGPGLDTGCTFNTSPQHPLIIDVVVDQFVGAVDGSGFLANPAPLIAAGIIPASVEVIMPAFDIDVNGSPPPEHDEVIFNGQNLGLLNGDNNIWLLNSFTVPISQIKFPAATGGTTTNRVQINVDLLATGRWCMAIDWVALVIPIRPKIALTLTVMGGNKVREIADDIIYKQSFDADCNVTTEIGPFDDFPFSGSSNKEVSLHTEIEFCPDTGEDPEVKAMWAVDGPIPLQTRGTSTWTGFKGDVKLKMLDRVAAGTTTIDYEIDSQTASVSRKLYVTLNTPRRTSDCTTPTCAPKRDWYKLATDWAQGAMGELSAIRAIRAKIYDNPLGWIYLDQSSPGRWQQLIEATVNNANCVSYSNVLQNLSAVIGVDAGTEIRVQGTTFITQISQSLDPNFIIAGEHPSGAFDRYGFTMHSLVQKGSRFQDATFGEEYTSPTQFIIWTFKSPTETEKRDGFDFYKTNQGALVRISTTERQPEPYFSGWRGVFQYRWRFIVPPLALPAITPSILETAGDQVMELASPALLSAAGSNARFTGNATYALRDDDLDGLAEALTAEVEVEILQTGTYFVNGTLMSGATLIASRPDWQSMGSVGAVVSGSPGLYTATFDISGEEIFQSGIDGPYDLDLQLLGDVLEDQFFGATPGFTHSQFGELPMALLASTDQGEDLDADGKFDVLRASVTVDVRVAGDYLLDGSLWKDDQTLLGAQAAVQQSLGVGTHVLTLDFDGSGLRRAGLDGPYTLHLVMTETNRLDMVEETFATQAYTTNDFELALLDLDGNFNDLGIDTNSNGLFDILRVTFGADIQTAGTYLVSGQLAGPGGDFVAFTDVERTLAAGLQTLTLDFLGPLIRQQGIDGPYDVEIVMRDPSTFDELDRVPLGSQTTAYSFTDFDPFAVPAILLTDAANDFGVDTNANGLFDELHVEVEVALTTTDFYRWSARLIDTSGTEIDFDSRSGSRSAGTSIINFIFDGEKIGENGVNGPYFVKGLLMFGNSGPNTVVTDVAETQPYSFFDFEGGFVLPPSPHDFVLLADKKIKIDEQIDSEGDIHANDKVEFGKGKGGGPFVHTGNVTAVNKVKIENDQTIDGDVTAPKVELKDNATVLGVVTEAAVPAVPLPVLSFSAGGDKVKVKKDETLALPPGVYGDVKVEDRGTLILSSGMYFFKKLELKKEATLSVDPVAGPVEVNVVKEIRFEKNSEVEITLAFPLASRLLTINGLKDIKIQDGAVVRGNLIAPKGKVEMKKNAFFKGAICAREIDVKKGATFVPHGSSAAPLPRIAAFVAEAPVEGIQSALMEIPEAFALEGNYPNPFNPETMIRFAVPESAPIRLTVYDVLGRQVRVLIDGVMPAGTHEVIFEASSLPSGAYFYHLETPQGSFIKQMILVK